jgi:hypothetical protein
MLGLALQRCSEGEDLVFMKVGQRHDVGHAEAALGERSGLAKMTASRLLARSKAVRFRMSSPLLAESDVDTATTSGTARPSACGHVMTITVTMRSIAKSSGRPAASQATRVADPAPSAMIVSQNAARFARSCVFDAPRPAASRPSAGHGAHRSGGGPPPCRRRRPG